MTDEIWGEASTTHCDWHGTVRLDHRMTGPSLSEAVGLSRDQWIIAGLEISGGEGSHRLRVLAVSQDIVPEGGDVFPKIAAANGGSIPVTEFLIHDVDPYKILRAVTHDLDIRMRHIGTADWPIRITALGDVPEQD